MKKFKTTARLAALPLAMALAFPAFGQAISSAETRVLGESVVTATRSAARADELVSDVVVIGQEEIQESTARTLPELLARAAGVQMAANGGAGKTSSVFIRGTESRHTILLIDGVRYGSATAGTPVWDAVPLESIERIEVLKGPTSALYGSDGVGGVVQIFTKKGRTGFHPYASATVGSERYREWAAGMSGGQGALTYALGLQRKQERGTSATNPNVQFGNFNADLDPFKQDSLNASLAYQFTADWSANANLLYSDGVTHLDDGPGRDSRTAIRSAIASVGVKGRILPDWQTELSYGQSTDTSNAIMSSFLPSDFKTQQDQWTWQNTIATSVGAVVAGVDHRVQKVSGSTAYTVSERTIKGLFAGLSGSAGNHSWQLNARRDDNSQFGDADTWFAGYGYRISPAWRVHASQGTTFVAPSFNQLYYPGFGNPALQPESGKNTDVGVTWVGGDHEVKLVRFDNKIRGYMTNTTLPTNIPRTRIDGWTLGYTGRIGKLSVRASYDALDPRNELNGRQLPRRAKEQATVGADYAVGVWKLGGSVLHTGSRFDDAANSLPLGSYSTVDLYASYALNPDWSVQAKINNLTDRTYETAYGYNQAGRGIYMTLRWQPK